MLAEERFHEIIRLVNERKTMTVQELTELLDSSESTIRRDLTELHKRHQLVKVHGGATALQMGYTTKDEAVSVRKDMNMEEKQRIAKYAAERIKRMICICGCGDNDRMSDRLDLRARSCFCDKWNCACPHTRRERI